MSATLTRLDLARVVKQAFWRPRQAIRLVLRAAAGVPGLAATVVAGSGHPTERKWAGRQAGADAGIVVPNGTRVGACILESQCSGLQEFEKSRLQTRKWQFGVSGLGGLVSQEGILRQV